MPRDSNGNYTLPSGNPVVTDTLIASTWANPTMGDLANEMQDSLSRSGKGGFEAPVGIVDKSGSVPGLNFIAEPTSGFKREGTEDLRMQVTTTDVWQATKTGVKVLTPDSGGVLKSPVVQESGQTVLRGESGVTVAFFYNDTAPPGWTLEEPDANIRELVIGPSGGGEGGTFAGSDDPINPSTPINTTVTVTVATVADTSDSHALTIAQMPSHAHSNFNTNGNQGATGSGVAGSPGGATGSQGGNAGHSHGIPILSGTGTGTGTGTSTFTPRYARGILAKLD